MAQENPERKAVNIHLSQKSMAIAIILPILFGPLGLLYSTIRGGVIMLIACVVIGVPTFFWALLVLWPICVIWGAVAADSYNKKLVAGEIQF